MEQPALFEIERTAELVRMLPRTPAGASQRLYHVSPPMLSTDWETDEQTPHPYVITSAVVVSGCPETYIFPANEAGEVTSFGELAGSFRGALDHERALRNAGYRA